MARFVREPERLNATIQQAGKEYNLRLANRAQVVFTNLMNLLPSNYISTVQGPNYTLELKAVAVELARLELALEDVAFDFDFTQTRPEFIYSLIGYLVFLNGKLPTTSFDDQDFKDFLLDVIRIYYQGSVPSAIREGVQLFTSNEVAVTEDYLLVRAGAFGYDISDQFGFRISIESLNGAFPTDAFSVDSNIRLILNIIRPAHTLFSIRYVFKDKYEASDQLGKILDASRCSLSNYYYDDFRVFTRGLSGRDYLGVKTNQQVVNEDHSMDF